MFSILNEKVVFSSTAEVQTLDEVLEVLRKKYQCMYVGI